MGWLNETPEKNQGPRNPLLVAAIHQALPNPSPSNRQVLFKAFLESTLLMGLQTLPEDLPRVPQALERDTPISILTSTNAEGNEVLPLFSDVESLKARNPRIPWVAMSARDILELALANQFAGIVINPAGSWVELSLDEIKSLAAEGNEPT